MQYLLLFALLFHTSSAVRVVVTFNSAQDRLDAEPSNVTGFLQKSFGRRHVLDLENMTFTEAQELLPFSYMPVPLVSIEEDLLLSADQGNWSDSYVVEAAEYNATAEGSTEYNATAEGSTFSDFFGNRYAWNLADDQPYSIHVERIRQLPNVGPNITVAVLDSGLPSISIPLFVNVAEGYDFVSAAGYSMDGDGRDSSWLDPGDSDTERCPQSSWHGLQVSAVLEEIASMAVVMPVRVLGRCKTGLASDVSDAVRWAAGGFIQGVPDNQAPAKVISMSFSGRGDCPSYLQSSIDYALSSGSVLIAAAGNNAGDATEYFPGNCAGVFPVAASNQRGELASYSNTGSMCVAAPGSDIPTLSLDANASAVVAVVSSGTSFSTVHLSGVLALLTAKHMDPPILELLHPIDYALGLLDARNAETGRFIAQNTSTSGVQNYTDSLASFNATVSGSASTCTAGYYNAGTGSVCTVCPANTFSNAGATRCQASVGYFGPIIHFPLLVDTANTGAYSEISTLSAAGGFTYSNACDSASLCRQSAQFLNPGGVSLSAYLQVANPYSGPMTVSYWAKSDSNNVGCALSLDNGNNAASPQTTQSALGFLAVDNPGASSVYMYAYLGTWGCGSMAQTKAANLWHHVAYTISSGNNILVSYMNGAVTNTGPICTGSMQGYQNFIVGACTNGPGLKSGFVGSISDVRVYYGVLTASQVLSIYTSAGTAVGVSCTASCVAGQTKFCTLSGTGVCCGAGQYYVSGEMFSSTCKDCPRGTYSTALVATSADTCVNCPSGTYSSTAPASSAASCVTCPADNSALPFVGALVCQVPGTPTVPWLTQGGTGNGNCIPWTYGDGKISFACFGWGDQGRRGDGTTTFAYGTTTAEMNALNPLSFPSGLTPASSCGGYSFNCVLFSSGGIGCWGYNAYGQLGIGNVNNIGDGPGEMGSNLALVDLPAPAVQMSCGYYHVCAVLTTGKMVCWGRNGNSNLGNGGVSNIGDGPGEMGSALVPVPVAAGLSVVKVSSGNDFVCVLLSDNNVYCWGLNTNGVLGLSNIAAKIPVTTPMIRVGLLPSDLGTVVNVSCGLSHVCVLSDTGKVVCWGTNTYGQLGIGSVTSTGTSVSPLKVVQMPTGEVAVSISAGSDHTCALLKSGNIACWGFNNYGQLGIGNQNNMGDGSFEMGNLLQPVRLPTYVKAIAVSCFQDTTCALLNHGRVACYGYNAYGGLGIGSSTSTTVGTTVGSLTKLVQLPCGAGSYSAGLGTTTCSRCTIGTYSTTLGAVASTICINCGAGTYSTASGVTTCVNCAAGTYSSALGATVSTICTNCGAGTYSTVLGATVSTICTACRAGTYSTASGVATCVNCAAGTYGSGLGLAACVLCTEAGTYQSGVGSTQCSLCQQGQYSVANPLVRLERSCGSGVCSVSQSSSITVNTAAAYALDNDTTTMSATDFEADPWWRIDFGTQRLVQGVTVTYQSADMGPGMRFWVGNSTTYNGVSNSLCYTQAAQSSTASFQCTAYAQYLFAETVTATGGYSTPTVRLKEIYIDGYLLPIAVACTQCSAGTYSTALGATVSTTCISCGAGTYSTALGAAVSTTCINCGAGTYSTVLGATLSGTCTNCGAGTYSTVLGAAGSGTCTNCVAGTYSTALGATVSTTCTNCVAGTYNSGSGATICLSCAAGTYADGVATGSVGTSLQSSQCPLNQTFNNGMCSCMTGYYIPLVQCAGTSGTSTTYNWDNQIPTACTAGNISMTPADPAVSMAAAYEFYKNVTIRLTASISSTSSATNLFTMSDVLGGNAFGTDGATGTVPYFCLDVAQDSNFAVSYTLLWICWNGYSFQFFDQTQSSLGTLASYNIQSSTYQTYQNINVAFDNNLLSVSFTPGNQYDSRLFFTLDVYLNKGTSLTLSYEYQTPVTCLACSEVTPEMPAFSNNQCSTAVSAATSASPITNCTPCASGTYSTLSGATAAATCQNCVAGTYLATTGASDPVSCALCGLGTYSTLSGATAAATCQSCAMCSFYATQNTFCLPGSTVDTAACTCNGGYSGTGFTCSACAVNSWCVGQVSTPCPQYSSSPALAYSQNQCLCNPGFFGNGSINATSPCALCFAGSYCPGGNSNLSTVCPTNAISQPGAYAKEQCYCPSGYYGANGTNCTLCPPNDYCASGILSVCPANSFAPQSSSKIQDCKCNAGFYAADGVSAAGGCTVCPINSYCPTASLTFTSCVTNAVTATVQTTSSQYCYCDRGYAGVSNSNCVACAQGQWCWTGLVGTCPANSNSPALSSYLANCTCNAGYYVANMTATGSCSICQAGTYSIVSGVTTCQNCTAGTYSAVLGATAASTCLYCTAGLYSTSAAATMCLSCASGTYQVAPALQNLVLQRLEKSCGAAANSWCNASQSSIYGTPRAGSVLDDDVNTYTHTAVSGDYNPWWLVDFEVARAVQSGTIWPRQNCCLSRSNNIKIWVGDNATYNGAGNVNCFTGPAGDSLTIPFTCAATGRYFFLHQPNMNGGDSWPILNIAEVQVWGFVVGNTVCTSCAAGNYSSTVGATTCLNCAAGTYSTTVGATSAAVCGNCGVGLYSTALGASTCTSCGAGSYSTAVGATTCLPCLRALGIAGSPNCTTSLDAARMQAGGYYDLATAAQVAFYPFNPAQPLVDASGNGKTLTATTSPPTAIADGPWVGSFAASFSAPSAATLQTNSSAQHYVIPALTLPNSLTVCAWYSATFDNTSNQPTLYILRSAAGGGRVWGYQCQTNDQLCVSEWQGSGSNAQQLGTWGTSSWSFLCQSLASGINLNACLNGTCSAYTIQSWARPTNPISPDANAIGYSVAAYPFTAFIGQIAQFRIFNRSLTTTEMQALYTYRGDTTASLLGTAACPVGYYCAPNNTAAVACASGSYAAATGLTACVLCSSGQYASTTGQTVCTQCVAGTYSTASGASSAATCANCVAGTYSTTVGAVSFDICTFCTAAGQYQSAAGSTQCVGCPAGQFRLASGSLVQLEHTCGVNGTDSCSAIQTSTNWWQVTADKAVDKNYGSPGSQTNGSPSPAWWRLDFGVVRMVQNVVISHWSQQSYDMHIWVGTNPVYNGVGNRNCYTTADYPNFVWTSTFTCTALAQYVFVQSDTRGIFMLEIDIYGYLGPVASACTSCMVGTYSTALAATSTATCLNCAAGSYSNASGATSNTTCLNCAAGTYSSTVGATSACLPCLSGQGPTGSAACTVSLDTVRIQQGGYYDWAAGIQMAYYPFNPAYPLADASGNGRTLSASSSPPTAAADGRWSGVFAASFNPPSHATLASDVTAQYYNMQSLTLPPSFTVCMHHYELQDTSNVNPQLFQLRGADGSRVVMQQLSAADPSRLQMVLYTGTTSSTRNAYNHWGVGWAFTCLAVTDGHSAFAYYDGYPQTWEHSPTLPVPFLTTLNIIGGGGSGGGQTAYWGKISQFRLFNRSLSSVEMTTLHNFRGDVADSPVIAYLCPTGYACPPNNTAPVACSAGTYASASGQSACTPCPAGTYFGSTGATASSTCVSCGSGSNSTVQGATGVYNCSCTQVASTTACSLCSAGSYSPLLSSTEQQGAYACSLPPMVGGNLRTGMTIPSSFDVTFTLTLFSIDPNNRRNIFGIRTGPLDKVFAVYIQATSYYLEIALQDASGNTRSIVYSGVGTLLTLGTPVQVKVSRRGLFGYVYYNGIQQSSKNVWPSMSSIEGAWIYMGSGDFSIQNLVYQPMVSCAACSAGQYSTALGAIAADTCASCAAGTYSTALGATSPGTCLPCTSGTFGTALGATS